MRLPRFEYVKPESVEECLTILEKSGRNAGVLAGGTDLLVNMKYGVKRPEKVISIKTIPGLCNAPSTANGYLHIGPCNILSDLTANSLITEKYPALSVAIKSVASKHIRNMASIGGNICLDTRCQYYNQSKLWRDSRAACYKTGGSVCHAVKGSNRCHAINSSDTAPILIALNAEIVAQKSGHERAIPIKDFYQDNGAQPTALNPDELLTSIKIPDSADNSHSAFIKLSFRKGIDFAVGSIAAHISGSSKKCKAVRLIIGSFASAPLSLEKAANIIAESGLTDKSIETAAETARSELGTLTNLFTSAGYKRDISKPLVKRALLELKEKMKKRRSTVN